MENTSSVSESSSEENTTIVVSSCEGDSEYFSLKKYHHPKHGVNNRYVYILLYILVHYSVLYIYQIEGNVIFIVCIFSMFLRR